MRLNARRKCYCRWHRYRRCWRGGCTPQKITGALVGCTRLRTLNLNTTTGVLAGMQRAQLERALADAQQAYLLLSTGSKYESVSFAQGDGSKSVIYTRANLAQLVMLIKTLQAQLGLIPRARAPLRFLFR